MSEKIKKAKQEAKLFQQIVPLDLKKGDLRKLEIIRAAIRCISENGYENTNFETVGQLCNMKRPHVAYHFPKKEQIISAAIRYSYSMGQEIVIDHLKHASGAQAKLKAYIEGTFHWFESNPYHGSVVMLCAYLSTREATYKKLTQEFKRIGTERVFSMLGSESNQRIADAVHVYIAGRVIEWLTCGDSASLSAFRKKTVLVSLKMAQSLEIK
jgi:AcrR family transcriptional regulator